MKESFQLIGLFFLVKWRQFQEERRIRKLYYSNDSFRTCDLLFHKAYLFHNPYQISKNFLMQKGEKDLHVYGETPITSLFQIAKKCGLKTDDYFLELGSGRGRGIFFLSQIFGCKAKGIEWIPEFVDKAESIAKQAEIDNAYFSCEDMLEVNLSESTVIYLYGTCLDEFSICKLVKNLEKAHSSIKIITVSYPLTTYSDLFKIVDQFTVPYPWGDAEVYINCFKS